jgi:hypothetical protein
LAASLPPESLSVVIALVSLDVLVSPVSVVMTGIPALRQVLMAGAMATGSVGETMSTLGCSVQIASTMGVCEAGAKFGEPWYVTLMPSVAALAFMPATSVS